HCDGPPACGDRCDAKAARLKRRCLRRGGSEADCAAKADALAAACRDQICVARPPDTCNTDCEESAKKAGEQCLAEPDANQAECEALAQGTLDQGVATCGAAPDATCAEGCEADARDRY